MTFHHRTPGAVFNPEEIGTIDRAYRNALEILARRPQAIDRPDQVAAGAALAKAVMDLARSGERDADRLVEKALVQMALVQRLPEESKAFLHCAV